MKYIALHNTAVKRTSKPQLYAVDRYHKDKWNMKSRLGFYVGYNFFCDVNGKETQTRVVGEETIANKGHNCDVRKRCDTVSYCIAFDGAQEFPSYAQERTFEAFVKRMRLEYPKIQVVGHRTLQKGRTCPGTLISDDYIDKFNISHDKEDNEKALQISQLQSKLDYLRNLLNSLLQSLKK